MKTQNVFMQFLQKVKEFPYWEEFKSSAYYFFRPWQNFKRLKRAMNNDFTNKEYIEYRESKERKKNEKYNNKKDGPGQSQEIHN